MRTIDSVAALEALYPAPAGAAVHKVTPALTDSYRAWIEASRFCILSTVGAQGVHATPRGDDGPVVRVGDARTLLMPDWRGNNRLEALRDIVTDGRVALLFLVAGSTTTLRVNGRAVLTDDPALCDSFARKGRTPATVIVVTVAEVYSQCAKALMRAGLWGRDDAGAVPTAATMLAEATGGAFGATPPNRAAAGRDKPDLR